ncbi:TetR/AcrR family transcriptional regulator [Halopseudomonas bauzanensis]|uniref:TetR/AcrR family transcriptional regulator n=1 Tax=Halopseudomonas bauzanensis TaxID=653930 RepID=UPI002553D792|nr:TetR/AcrR family transcriptional regulator [Halopseudomonas bauzanensis]
MKAQHPKRLSPEARRAQILKAASDLLAESGLNNFSLEAVARKAGVAATLPRYYFGATDELLRAATQDIVEEVERVLLAPEPDMPIRDRFARYLATLKEAPWGHDVWMRASDLHTDLENIVQTARQHMVEGMYGKAWNELDPLERYEGCGRIGYIEAVVAHWIEHGMKDTAMVVDILTRSSRSLSKPKL